MAETQGHQEHAVAWRCVKKAFLGAQGGFHRSPAGNVLCAVTEVFLQATGLLSSVPEARDFRLFRVLSAGLPVVLPDIARVVGVGRKPLTQSQLHLPFENGTRHLCFIFEYFCCWLF